MNHFDKTRFEFGATVSEGSRTEQEVSQSTHQRNAPALGSSSTMADAALGEAAERRGKSRHNTVIHKGGTIFGTYRVDSDAIEGGMGSVWRVHHTGWNVDLAMKRPQPQCFSSEESKADFINECEAWINLGLHPNIVACYYVREIGGTPTIFSEWMDGGSLENAINNGTLYRGSETEQRERILDIAIQFARGLQYAHEAELIHRDVKPDNLLLTCGGEAKVADFGLALARAQLTQMEQAPVVQENVDMEVDESEGLSHAHAVWYSPAYCSMEQMDQKELTYKTDIYSWAVSVMEMYIGFRPWTNGVVAGLNCRDYFKQFRLQATDAMKDLLSVCLADEPEKRLYDFIQIEERLRQIYQTETDSDYPRSAPRAAADTADSLNNRALSFLDLGKNDEAEKCWESAVEINPDHSDVRYNYAVYQWRAGKISADNATVAVRMNFENHFGDPKSSVYLARVWLERGDKDYAIGYLGQAGGDAEGAAELHAAIKRGEAYRGEYALCRIRNYKTMSEQLTRYFAREAKIEGLLNTGEIEEANKLLSASAVEKEYRDFAFSPAGIQLNDRISEVGYPMLLLASWCMRTCGKYASNLCFSPDGETILVGADLFPSRGSGRLFHYGPEEKPAARSSTMDELYQMVNALGGKMVFQVKLPDTVYSSFDHTGSYFLRAQHGGRDFVMVDTVTGEVKRTFEGHINNINSLFISADGTLVLSGSDDETARLWRASDGQCARILQSGGGPVKKVALSYDNRHALLLGTSKTRMFDLSNGQVERVFDVPDQKDFCVNTQFERIVFACGKAGLYSYILTEGESMEPHHHYDQKNAARGRKKQSASCVCFLPDDQHVLAGAEDMLHLWFLEQNSILSGIDCGASVTGVATDGSGKRIAAMTMGGAQIWCNYYNYYFGGWRNWGDRLDPYAKIFLARYPDYTEKDVDRILLPELKRRGHGSVRRESVLEAVSRLQKEKQKQTAATVHAAEEMGFVEPLTSSENGMKIHNGLIFGYQGTESELTIPRGTIKIGRRTFEKNCFLKTVRLPYGLEEIQEGAFRGCAALERINIPSTLKKIDKEAFSDCKKLVHPTIPAGIMMDESAF